VISKSFIGIIGVSKRGLAPTDVGGYDGEGASKRGLGFITSRNEKRAGVISQSFIGIIRVSKRGLAPTDVGGYDGEGTSKRRLGFITSEK